MRLNSIVHKIPHNIRGITLTKILPPKFINKKDCNQYLQSFLFYNT